MLTINVERRKDWNSRFGSFGLPQGGHTSLRSAKRKSITFHAYTIWLFTYSDIKSVIIPQTLLGLSTALSGSLLTTNNTPHLLGVLAKTPQIALWNWLNLFLFDVDNQMQSDSVLEDSLNKPWRAIPSQRLTAIQARHLLLCLIPTVFAASVYLGGVRESVTLTVGTLMYNDLHGADENFVIRNLLNAFGYICYSSGSMIVAAGYGQHELNDSATWWLAIIGAIIFTTLQMQDMPDVEGDAARDRKTIPLIYGDWAARISIAVPVTAWSFICPTFWRLGIFGYIVPVAAGAVFILRLLILRSTAADAVTWKLWCVWIATIYLLPVFKEHGISL